MWNNTVERESEVVTEGEEFTDAVVLDKKFLLVSGTSGLSKYHIKDLQIPPTYLECEGPYHYLHESPCKRFLICVGTVETRVLDR